MAIIAVSFGTEALAHVVDLYNKAQVYTYAGRRNLYNQALGIIGVSRLKSGIQIAPHPLKEMRPQPSTTLNQVQGHSKTMKAVCALLISALLAVSAAPTPDEVSGALL